MQVSVIARPSFTVVDEGEIFKVGATITKIYQYVTEIQMSCRRVKVGALCLKSVIFEIDTIWALPQL